MKVPQEANATQVNMRLEVREALENKSMSTQVNRSLEAHQALKCSMKKHKCT